MTDGVACLCDLLNSAANREPESLQAPKYISCYGRFRHTLCFPTQLNCMEVCSVAADGIHFEQTLHVFHPHKLSGRDGILK